jgi:hypothetical protein
MHTSREIDEAYESELRVLDNRYNWSVKNQARMHIRNNLPPYGSVEEAMRQWSEICTIVGVRLNEDNSWTILAPYGLEDLFALVIRRSPNFKDAAYFMHRIESKQWLVHWYQLRVIES